jgi:endoglucanase
VGHNEQDPRPGRPARPARPALASLVGLVRLASLVRLVGRPAWVRGAVAASLALALATVMCVLAATGLSLAATGAAASDAQPAAPAAGVGSGYWHTSGNQILDSAGNPVRIAGINWYGFETPDEIAHGLWVQDYHSVINDIKSLGYNTIRIPFSNQMVETPIVPQNLSFQSGTGPINTDLEGLTSMQDLQKIVTYAGQDGLKVILDDHRSEAGESAENNGLWYTSTYTSANWVNDWATLAKMFAGNPTVVGFDLRNEPHTPAGDTYAQGATWGTGTASTDVRLAYEQAGNAVLAADPGALIFCEGISENPTSSGTFNTTWWGGDLAEAGQFPVVLSSAGHVVYSAHDYGPSLFQQTWFNSSTTAASLDAVWNQNWGYLYNSGTAPVWVGEFGTDNTASDVQSSAAGSQGQWFEDLVSYLHGNPWMGWTYWALNGEDSYDLLDNNYDPAPVSAPKQSLLAGIQFPLPGAVNGTPPPTGSAAPVSCSAVYSLTNSWQGGFQGQVVLTNTGSTPISGWKLTWTFGGDQKIGSMWTASFTQSGESVTAVNQSYNASITAASSVTIGFTGTFTSSDAAPSSFAVNGTACTS